MIRSCEFSFDDNCVWDSKVIRQHLIISEDQLNILSNIPEWIKEKNTYYSRLDENDTGINSQIQLNSSNSLLRSKEVVNCNIKLFDRNFDSREKIIRAFKLNALKFSKSISLFEIDKISTKSPCGNHLSPALSLPNLSLLSKDFSFSSKIKSYLYEKSDLSTQLTSVVLNTGEGKTCIEKPNMEVVSQLPVVVPQIVKNNENFAIVDKTILSTGKSIQSDSSSNSCNLLSTFVDVNKSDNLSSVATKKTNLVEIDDIDSGAKNVESNENKQIIVGDSDLDLNEKTIELTEPIDLNIERMETDSSIAKKSSETNNLIHDVSEKVRSELEGNINQKNELPVIIVEKNDSSLNKENKNETYVENAKQLSVVPQLSESKITPVSCDELKSKLIDSAHDSKMDTEVACHGAGDGQVKTSHNLPLKRKSESKSRSSKRSKGSREKLGCPNERSIKKAGEINYAAEDMKTLFDLLKLFI